MIQNHRGGDREAHDELFRRYAGREVTDSVAPPEKVSQKEMEEIVDKCLSQLPEEQPEIIVLVDYARDWELVAERCGRLSAGAAQQFHRRARVSVAARVERRLGR